MDESNADMGLRAQCLGMAITANSKEGGDPYFITEQAREFYLFLSGRDPVVDTTLAAENVVLMSDYK